MQGTVDITEDAINNDDIIAATQQRRLCRARGDVLTAVGATYQAKHLAQRQEPRVVHVGSRATSEGSASQ